MSGSLLRTKIKPLVPRLLWTLARAPVTFLSRVMIWRRVVRELKGASRADEVILHRSFRRGLISAARELDDWQDPQLVADATISVPGGGTFDCRAFTDDLYHLLPSREAAVLETIRGRLREGSTFVDAGANIGFFTVLAAQIVGPSGRVFAIEMLPETADRLRRHVRRNGLSNVTVVEEALSDESGQEITATVPEHKFGRASIVLGSRGEVACTISVHTRTMDEIFAEVDGMIDLIKMDLEGAEAKALRGGARTLARTRAVIFEQLPGETAARTLLEDSGFEMRTLDGNNLLAVRR
jgi:FkbM family methyltransferase